MKPTKKSKQKVKSQKPKAKPRAQAVREVLPSRETQRVIEAKHPGGRPSKYTPEVVDLICDQISTSTIGLKRICENDSRLPSAKVIYEWLEKYPEFRDKYARAREAQADILVEEIIEISDATKDDTIHVDTKNGGYDIPNSEWINRSRLRVDSRKWIASKLAPKKYGDKIDVTSGGNTIAPLIIQVQDEETRKALESL